MGTTTALALPNSIERAIKLIDQGREFLEKAKTIEEAKRVLDLGEMLRHYVKKQRAAEGAERAANILVVRATAKVGELYEALDKNKGGRPSKTGAHVARVSKSSKLQELGISNRSAERAAEIGRFAKANPEAFEEFLEKDPEPTKRGALRLASGGKPSYSCFSSESYEWYTPPAYIESARKVLGGIDLDPASSAEANRVVKAAMIFEKKDGGLSKDWTGRVWCNPPYGSSDQGEGVKIWVEKFCEASKKDMSAGILLVNAVTDRSWFNRLWRFPICFTHHRIEFYTRDGQPKAPLGASAFVYHGPDVKRFAREFAKHGTAVLRID